VSRPFRFAVLVALVVLAHSVVLNRLSDALEQTTQLKTMATPMFTRVLQPREPAPIAAAPPATVDAPKPRRPSVTVAKKAAAKPAKAASAPASAPEAVTEPVAAASTDTSEPGPEAAAAEAAAAQAAASAPVPPAESTASAPTAPASAPALAVASLDTWPVDTRLSYRLSGWFRGELYGSASVQWQRENDQYQNRVEIDIPPFVWFVITSQGEVTQQGLSPRVYEEQRRSKVRAVRVNDDDVTLNDGRHVPRPAADLQDTASQFVELAHRFATGREKLEVGRRIEFWLARPNGVDLWSYDIVERQMLSLRGLGVVEAYHLQPRPIENPRGNITAEIWFAPALQYLPVRIRVNMGDIFVELTAEKIEQK